LDEKFVMGALRYHGQENDGFVEECKRKGFVDYSYCVVMKAGERNLADVIAHEHFAGRDWGKVREVTTQLLRALEHMHQDEILHGGKRMRGEIEMGGGGERE
jgi:hypothetical protein